MPETVTPAASFAIDYCRFSDAGGEAGAPLPEFAAAPAELIKLHRAMALTRVFDAKAIAALLRLDQPVVRARYEFAEAGEPRPGGIVDAFIAERGVPARN